MKKKETIRSLWTPTAGMLSGARRAAMLLLTTLLLTMTAQTAWAETEEYYVTFKFEDGATVIYRGIPMHSNYEWVKTAQGIFGNKEEVEITPPTGKVVSYACCDYTDGSEKQRRVYLNDEGNNVWSFTIESLSQNSDEVRINIFFIEESRVLNGNVENPLASGTYFCKSDVTYDHSLQFESNVSIEIAPNATLTINSSDGSGLSAAGNNINIIGLDKESSLLNITSTGENSTAITASGIILHNLTVNATSGATVIKASDNLTINSSTVTATTTGTSEDYGIYAGNGAINVNLGPTDFLLASSFNKVLTIPEETELLAIESDGSVSGIFKYDDDDTVLGIINGKTLRAANYCGSSNYDGKDLVWYLTTGSDAAKTLHIEKNPDPEISGSDLTIYNFENTFSSVKNSITQIVFSDDIVGIGASAFSGCSALATLTLGSGVESIGAEAFSGCKLLTELTIPDNVTSIGDDAFSGCGLTALTIPDNVTSIGEQAFSGCEALASATIPNNNEIAPTIFEGCTNLKTLTISGGSSAISAPNPAVGSLSGVITTLIIGNDIEEIGDYAFTGCSKLTDLTIGNNVTSIGESAFSGCELLTALTIPGNVTTIGASAFSGCSALATLTLGSSVKSIGAEAFSGCKLLTELTIPDNVTSIGDDAFSGCGLTALTIPDNVTSIGEQAFSGCEALASATIPNNNEIAPTIFEGCTNLTTLTISGGSSAISAPNPAVGFLREVITTLIIGNDIEEIGDYAFTGCSKLTDLTIGSSVTSIGESAFSGCELLTALTIPDNVTTIGASAFSGCSALATLTLGSSVKSIGAEAFSDCKLLTELTIPDNVTSIGDDAFSGCGLTTLTIPDNVTSIGEQAFSGCESLASATIPNNEEIASDIFNECTNLKTLTINGSGTISGSNPAKGSLSGVITTLTIGDGIVGIDESAFMNCSKLTDLTIGSSVTSIGESAFSGCELLTALTIPDNVTTIGASAFSGCSALATLTLGSSVKSIGAEAFSGCKLLTELTIPDNVTSIGDDAFSGCGLTTLTIPEKVTTIGEQAFSDCKDLASATIPNNNEIAPTIFEGCTNLTTLTISGSGPISASNPAKGSLSEVITTLIIGDYIEGIGERAFTGCSKLTDLTIGSSVTSIGESAFSGCGLTALTIPDNVTTIGASAFSGCSALATLTLGSGVRTIGASAFSDCGLTTLTIPDNVMSIGDYAFQNAFADNVCKVITMEGETPPTLGSGPFTDSESNNYIILVPEAVYSVYCDDNSWAQYKNGDWITPQTITIKTYGGWASYCHKYHIGYDVTTESASAKVVTGLGEAILVEDQTNILPYDPVLINYTGQDDGQVILTANVETPNLPFSTIPNNTTWGGYSTVSYDSNLGMVQAYSVETITIQGNPGNEAYASGSSNNIFAISDFSDTQSYVLRNGNFVAVDKDGGIGAHRCWLNVKKSAANGARLLRINTGGATAIENYQLSTLNSQLNEWYGLDGRKLDKQPTKKGLYIYNGKKHVIK